MALTNAYLVRWARGLLEVADAASIAAYGRHEGYLPLNGSQSPQDASQVAERVLAVRAYPQLATTIGLRPTGAGDNPYVDFDLGDWLSAPDDDGTTTPARVRSLSTRDHPDNTGQVVFTPELRSLPAESEDVLGRWLQRMATGGGASHSTAPSIPIPIPPRPEKHPLPEFSLAIVTLKVSGRYYAQVPQRLVKMVASLNIGGAATTTVIVRRNGAAITGAVASWGAGGTGEQKVELEVDLAVDDWLTTETTEAGPGAAGLTVQLEAI